MLCVNSQEFHGCAQSQVRVHAGLGRCLPLSQSTPEPRKKYSCLLIKKKKTLLLVLTGLVLNVFWVLYRVRVGDKLTAQLNIHEKILLKAM